MKCRQARKYLTEYAAQELSPRLAQTLTEHLASCARCAAEVREHAAIWALIHQLSDLPVAPGFNAAVWQRIRNPSRRTLFRLAAIGRRPQRFALAAVFASLIAVSGWLGYRTRPREAASRQPVTVTRDLPREFASAMAAYPTGSVGEAFLALASTTETSPGGDSSR